MKINNINLLCCSLLAVFLLSACKKTVYNQLSVDEEKWLVYMKGELIVFGSSGTDIDTFYVGSRVRGYIIDKPYYNEAASVDFNNPNDTINENKYGTIRIAKDKDNEFEAFYVFPHFPKKVYLSSMIPVPVDTINGIPYTNVFIAESDSSSYSPVNYIRKVYYTQKDGFIKLEDIYGGIRYKLN